MELSQLKYFLTTANSKSIKKASDVLHVSQSAISMSISRLEKELDVDLFQKKGRSIVLTSNGERFITMITPAITELEFAKNEMLHANQDDPNTITLSVEIPDFATEIESLYLAAFPASRFRQSFVTTDLALHQLLCDSIDFSFNYEALKDPDIISELIVQEHLRIQVSKNSVFADRKSLSLTELQNYPFVSLSSEYSYRRWTDGMCFLAGFHPNVCLEVCDTHALAATVVQQNAAAFIPESLYQKYNAQKIPVTLENPQSATISIPLTDNFCFRKIYVSYNKNRILGADAQTFLDFIFKYRGAFQLTEGHPTLENIMIRSIHS